MSFQPPPALTVKRIQEVVQRFPQVQRRLRTLARKGIRPAFAPRMPDYVAGETAQDVMAEQAAEVVGAEDAEIQRDWFRIMDVLEVLSRGTVEKEIARTASAIRAHQLRLAVLGSVGAVLDSLDVLEPHFGALVHDVRRVHRPETLQHSVNAAGARRTGDPRRPPLTEERIRLMLRLLADYAQRSPRIRSMLLEPMRLDETGADARKVLGVRLAASADRDAGGAEGLMRDVFWMMLIRARTGGGRNVDSWLESFEATNTPAAWMDPELPHSRKMKNIAAFASGASEEMVRLLRLVSRDEEAAVVACRGEIDAFLRTSVGGLYALSNRGTRRRY